MHRLELEELACPVCHETHDCPGYRVTCDDGRAFYTRYIDGADLGLIESVLQESPRDDPGSAQIVAAARKEFMEGHLNLNVLLVALGLIKYILAVVSVPKEHEREAVETQKRIWAEIQHIKKAN